MADNEIEIPITINVGNLCEGALIKKFDIEMRRCLENIYDLNTDAKTKRVMKFEVVLTPSDDRVRIDASVTSDVKLAPMMGTMDRFYVAKDKETGTLYAIVSDPRQLNIFEAPKPKEQPPTIEFKAAGKSK